MNLIIWPLTLSAESYTGIEKHYLSASDIDVQDATIFVHRGGQVYEIDTLLVDQGGVYYLSSHLRCPECRKSLNPKNTCHVHFESRIVKS
ncbi:MAG: hypothetical protein JSR97_06875 [Verrucomicrobia bacterium]|nr:hypothetical protein [Verrucomicrobiota bacterium]